MGVLAPRSVHAGPSAGPPIDASGNFSVHMSGGGQHFLKNFLINFLAVLGDSISRLNWTGTDLGKKNAACFFKVQICFLVFMCGIC